MAVGEGRDLRSQLLAWRWLLLYMLAAQLLRFLVPAFLPVSDPVNLLREHAAWVAGPQAQLRLTADRLDLRDRERRGRAAVFASRAVPVADGAQMLEVHACLGPTSAAAGAAGRDVALLLASVRSGVLDFNRSYQRSLLDERDDSGCTSGRFSRRRGDAQAVLQLQLGPLHAARAPGPSGALPPALRQLTVAGLEVTSLRENRTWRWLRRTMLGLGIALLVLHFYRYVPSSERLFSVRGLLAALGCTAVAGIVFGCTVSVPLKADIYELMTGGRVLAASGADLDELLRRAFPLGGFSIFTLLHAVLFAIAGTALGLTNRYLWPDLLLLGAVTETLQLFVPGRGPGVYDLLVDWSGVAIAALLVFSLWRVQRVRLLLQQQGVHEDVSGL